MNYSLQCIVRSANVHIAENLAVDKDVKQMSTETSGARAVDNNPDTSSCTEAGTRPWWTVDLGALYVVGSVSVTFPATNLDDCNYYYRPCLFVRLTHWCNCGSWLTAMNV